VKTTIPKAEQCDQKWYIVDADGVVLGRLATQVAVILRGKHKPLFTPHLDTGDFVVVVNAENVKLTGKKSMQKEYFTHSGYPGGEKFTTFKKMIEKHPEKVIEHAVKGMLPRNRLGRQLLRKLKIYRGNSHPHKAQNPQPLNLPFRV
jgi:large subunit ribosomal protein L13